jgi:hypothetical protein
MAVLNAALKRNSKDTSALLQKSELDLRRASSLRPNRS